MNINRFQTPAAAAKPAPARSNVLNVAEHFRLSPLSLGLDAVDLTASAAYVLSKPSDALSTFGGVVAGAHALTGFVVGMNGLDAHTRRDRDYAINRFTSELLLAAGHGAAALGLGAWALPFLGAGFVTSNLAQLRAPQS